MLVTELMSARYATIREKSTFKHIGYACVNF